jgi:hypothetical protein
MLADTGRSVPLTFEEKVRQHCLSVDLMAAEDLLDVSVHDLRLGKEMFSRNDLLV